MKILIVDDSQAMTAIVRRSVMSAGLSMLEIETARSGDEALEKVQSFSPDVVLTDWHMPGMSGLEMVQVMRQMGLDDIHVGFITTEAKPELMQESLRTGADFFLNKPFKDEDLWSHLKAIAAKMASLQPIGKPVLLEALNYTVRHQIDKIPFRIVEQLMTTDDLTDQNLLALYAYENSKSPMAIAVLEIHAVIIMGSAALGLQPNEVKRYMAVGKPSTEMYQQAAAFVGSVSGIIKGQQAAAPVHMLKQSLVSRDFPKLQELLRRNRGSSFFRIDIPGYGTGRMGFVLV